MDWPLQSSPIMLYISKIPDYPSHFVLNNQIEETIYEIMDSSCTEEHFQILNVEKDENFKYGCVDIYSIFGKNHKLFKNNKYFSFSITSCVEWDTFKIFLYQDNPNSFVVHPCPNQTVKSNEMVEVGFISKFNFFQKNVFGLPENRIHRNYTDDTGDLHSFRMDIWGNQLNDDTNWFTSSSNNMFFTSLTSLLEQNYVGFNNGLFGRLSVAVYQNENYYSLYTRIYSKFLDYIVNLVTIVTSINAVSMVIVAFFNEFYFLRHYQRFLQDVGDKQKKTLKILELNPAIKLNEKKQLCEKENNCQNMEMSTIRD